MLNLQENRSQKQSIWVKQNEGESQIIQNEYDSINLGIYQQKIHHQAQNINIFYEFQSQPQQFNMPYQVQTNTIKEQNNYQMDTFNSKETLSLRNKSESKKIMRIKDQGGQQIKDENQIYIKNDQTNGEEIDDDKTIKKKQFNKNKSELTIYSENSSTNDYFQIQQSFTHSGEYQNSIQNNQSTLLTNNTSDQQQNQQFDIKQGLLEKGYLMENFIDKGSFGQVFDGKKNQVDGKHIDCVFKILQYNNDKEKNMIDEEVLILKRFENNANLLKIIDNFKITEGIYVIVLEKCQCSLKKELDNLLIFPFQQLLRIIIDLIDGLIILKSYQILHFDIKPANILVNNEGIYVFSDFGLSFAKNGSVKDPKIQGFTRHYAALEVKQLKQNEVGNWIDVYSLGKTFQDVLKKYEQINGVNIQELNDLVNQMIQDEINLRPECLTIHEKLVEYVLKQDFNEKFEFFKPYSNKINQLLLLFPYDENKDIQFYFEIQIYYNKQLLKIYQNIYDSDLKSNFSELARLNYNIGNCYYKQRKRQEGLTYFEKSLDYLQQIYKDNHIDIASTKFKIGQCLFADSKIEKAYQFSQDAFSLRKLFFKGNHPDIVDSLNDLGMRFLNLGKYQEAQLSIQQSIDMSQAIYQQDHENTAIILNSLAVSQQHRGKYDEAEINLQRAYNILEKQEKKNQSYYSLVIQNIGNLNNFKCNYQKAEEYLKRSLEIRIKVFGENHQDTATNMNYLGDSYLGLGDYQKALEYHQNSLNIRQKIFQKDHATIATSFNSVGVCYQKLENYQEAEKCLFQSLEMRKGFQKINPLHIAISLNQIGEFYQDCKNYQKALEYHHECLVMAKQTLRNDHPQMIKFLNNFNLSQSRQINKSQI